MEFDLLKIRVSFKIMCVMSETSIVADMSNCCIFRTSLSVRINVRHLLIKGRLTQDNGTLLGAEETNDDKAGRVPSMMDQKGI